MNDLRALTAPGLISAVLLLAVGIDVCLAALTLLAPELWAQVLHGGEGDPGAPWTFLRRCGANWAAFAVLQAIALFRWRSAPHWLAVVAGVRFSDVATDWTYLAFSPTITSVGAASLALPGLLNLAMGWLMLRAWHVYGGGAASR